MIVVSLILVHDVWHWSVRIDLEIQGGVESTYVKAHEKVREVLGPLGLLM